MKLDIRRAMLTDIEQLIRLRAVLLDGSNNHYAATSRQDGIKWKSAYKEWLHRFIDQHDTINIMVAIDNVNKEIIACVIGIIDHRAPIMGGLNGKVGWIQTMVVRDGMQRRGIGDRLMHELLSWFRASDVGKIFLQTTQKAESFYLKVGFCPIDEPTLMKVI